MKTSEVVSQIDELEKLYVMQKIYHMNYKKENSYSIILMLDMGKHLIDDWIGCSYLKQGNASI